MSQENIFQPCPICGDKYVLNSQELNGGLQYRVECERCGNYIIERKHISDTDKPWSNVSHLVSAWVRRENKAGIIPNLGKGASLEDVSNPEWWKKQFRYMGFPETTTEKIKRIASYICFND